MLNFKKYNNIFGWLTFLIAAVTYTLTLEDAGSFWDCGEFISAAYKLQVVHPPGAPLFLVITRIFTLLAGGNTAHVAFWGNFCSGLCSAFTILFLFWSITYLAKKLLAKNETELEQHKLIAIIGSGLVGALAYTFSDTFWFSAVESEVYAMSSMCTAVVFWAILKWENIADQRHSDRWLVFIAFIMGLSIGVHLLNLLAIPAICFVYYFKRFKTSRKGIIYTAVASILILGFIQVGVIPGIVSFAAKFDLLFVNTLGLPFGSGVLVWAIILIAGTYFGIKYSIRKGKVILNTALLCFVAIVIGYSSYGIIVIRAEADPNINMYQTNDVFNLLSYLNRDQYGETPLLSGQYFTARPVSEEEGATLWHKSTDKYIETGHKMKIKWEESQTTFFPRIYEGQDPSHVSFYRSWLNMPATKKKPDFFSDNLKFFFTYQVNFMYFRYFMWNFAGRQNDIKGDGNRMEGNWISGIKPIDAARLGSQDNLPASITSNRANNKLYFLPLILGLIGLWFHFRKSKQDASVVTLLFFFTGLAIVLYLNQYPLQPRERDYAYVGSFYAFAIWIGLGVLALYDQFQAKMNKTMLATLTTIVCLLAVPTLMASQEWDDHDRSNRYTTRDFATDYLESCAPNAVLFSYGDNDTYPLWYAQEVEGIRTDVRVVNLSLLGMDWYISQMKDKTSDAMGVPFTLPEEKYLTGTRDYIYSYDMKLSGYTNVKEVLDFVTSDNQQTKVQLNNGKFENILPTKKFSLKVDRAQVLKTNTVAEKDSSLILPELNWTYPQNGMSKSELMVLDLIATNDWKRPVYFTTTMPRKYFFGLTDYLQLEGFAYRFVPIKKPALVADFGGEGFVNTDVMYNNIMNKFKWGNMNSKTIYLDPESSRMVYSINITFSQLAQALINEGKTDSAKKLLARWEEIKPVQTVPTNYNYPIFNIAEAYYKLGDFKQGNKTTENLSQMIESDLNYYAALKSNELRGFNQDIQNSVAILQRLAMTATSNHQDELGKKLNAASQKWQTKFMSNL